MTLDGFTQRKFTHNNHTLTVLERGTGPTLIILHEIRAATPEFLGFIAKIADHGFHVVAPVFYGTPGDSPGIVSTLMYFGRICVSREFAAMQSDASAPITVWLRALVRDLHLRTEDKQIGILGMCFTGNFALATLIEPSVTAAVISQPSLPMGSAPEKRRSLQLSPTELSAIQSRVHAERIPLLALRFSHDKHCPGERFERLQEVFGEAVECIEIDSGPGNPHNINTKAHCVLTRELVDQEGHPTHAAYQRVIRYFSERLKV